VYPGGRYADDAPYSGEEFLSELLVPAMEAGVPFVLCLDGTKGYGSAFLEEVFGGLVRRGYSEERIKELMELVSDEDRSLLIEIEQYISEEAERRNRVA